jgi:hypothetical protein
MDDNMEAFHEVVSVTEIRPPFPPQAARPLHLGSLAVLTKKLC